ncbi:MAG: ankyrin repeat domain-containing protein [Candidatus Schekmanbacteria bacterium]|nr:ankyrin repeat domain-containing protein [Candidatus Schekmanbacteria bacterium]
MSPNPSDLIVAINRGNAKAVDRLIAAGVSPHARVFGTTPLIEAARKGRNAIALRLVAAGADVDTIDQDGSTALYWATIGKMPKLAKAILDAPGEPLACARRILDGTDRDSGKEPPPCIAAAEAFAAEVVNGGDIALHLPMLHSCYQCFPHSWSETRESLESAICLQILRSGDEASIERLKDEARREGGIYRGDFAYAHGIAFADRHGAELRPLYPLLIERQRDGVFPLDWHLELHPERLTELAKLLLAQARARLPPLLSSFSSPARHGDATPASTALVHLLRSDDHDIHHAAAATLQALTKQGRIDLTPAAADLTSLLSDGRDAELVAELLVRQALARRPVDWDTVDSFCLHSLEDGRKGAVQALFWEWTEVAGSPELTARLARALMDEAAMVRTKAATALAEGRRLLKSFSPIGAEMLAQLVSELSVPSKACSIAELLAEYVRAEHPRAADLLSLLQASSSANESIAAGLATISRQIIEGSHVAPCSICRYLQEKVEWGEEMLSKGFATTDPPPQVALLKRLNQKQYCCPECGTYYILEEGGGSFLNAEWTNWTLHRVTGLASEAPWVRTHELIKSGDFDGLDRALLRSTDHEVRMETIETLGTQVAEGLDIVTLEPTLRELLSGAADLARTAAELLARHLIRKGEQSAMEGMLRSERPDVLLGTLYAIDHVALEKPAEVRVYLGLVRPFLKSPEERLRSCAKAILMRAGIQKEEAEATVSDATRRLESPMHEERAAAASLLCAVASEHLADIQSAVPRLAALARDKDATPSERYAAEAAVKSAGGESEHLGGISGLVERLRRGGTGDYEVQLLSQMRARGEDISPAFEALATKAGWYPLDLLKSAAIQGDDLTSAVAPLQKLVERADREPVDRMATVAARAAVGILACHYCFRKNWKEANALLSAKSGPCRDGVCEIANVLTGHVWGKQNAGGDGRRGAASALAYLSLWAERSDIIFLAFDLKLPKEVIDAILEGLLEAAKSGIDIEHFLGRLRKLGKHPLAAEVVRTVSPAPLLPVERTEWHSGRDHLRVTDTEVICWSGEGSGEAGGSCSLQDFLEGEMYNLIRSLFGTEVFRAVFNAVKSRVTPAPEARPRRRKALSGNRPGR